MGLVPGPVVTSLFAETIRKGWLAARRVVAWAAAGELVMSVACVAALSTVVDPKSPILAVLSTFGALVLLGLARDLWKVEEIAGEEPLFSNRRIFTIAVLNGMAWIFWITVCTPQAVALDGEIRFGRWLFIALFELGWTLSTLTLCWTFGLFRPYFQSQRRLHILYRAVAVLFVLFAIKLAVGSARALLK
jgi:threonine/homoserine/homoserine lactone efflux protein